MGFIDFLLSKRKVSVKSPISGKVLFTDAGIVIIENVTITGLQTTTITLGQVVKRNQVIGYK